MITFQENIFNEDSQYISFEKFFEESNTTLGCMVRIGNSSFSDYQQDIFQEVLGELVEFLQGETVFFDEIRSFFEQKLQFLNIKLQAFGEKMESDNHYALSGVMHLISNDQYISSLIGSSSLHIFRDEKLVYSVDNEENLGKIDLFGEIIEGDLEDEDRVIIWGTNISVYLDQEDLKTVSGLSYENEKSFVEQLLDIVSVRTQEKNIGFYQDIEYSTGKKLTSKKLKKGFGNGFKFVGSSFDGLKAYSRYLSIGGLSLFVALLGYWALAGFLGDTKTVVKDANGDVLIDFGIEDIQQDIAIFKQISPNKSEKVEKYNEIIYRLDLLEKNNLWVYDVTELRSILDQDYKEGFNIKLINTTELLGEPVYTFSQQEKNTMGSVNQVYYSNGFHVGAEDGVLIGAINESVRGSLVASAIGQKLEQCGLNLLKNGLLCSASDGSIYNADKNGFTPVVTDDQKFPRAIQDIGTWSSSNMYVLTNDDRINNEGTYILKYQNKLGSRNEFGGATRYPIKTDFNTDNNTPFASGASSFSIDGTFLVWSKGQKKLYQMFREGTTDIMIGRNLPLVGGDTVSNPFSEEVRVITSLESRYLYLFDPVLQSFTVYRSTPYKTTPGGERERTPDYAFMIKFDLAEDLQIIDAFVEEGELSNIFLLTKDSIYKVPLHEYIAQYIAEQE